MNLKTLFAQLQGKRVTIIGDIIVDAYLWGDVNRISPEAPVPVFDITSEATGCGGAANVAQNVVSVGGRAELVGVIGKDSAGEKLRRMLAELQIGGTGIYTDAQRPTSTKTRAIVNENGKTKNGQGHHLLRIDKEAKHAISPKLRQHLLDAVTSRFAETDAIVFADYDKGVVSPELIRAVVKQASPLGIPIIADPKQKNFWDYTGVTAITPNQKEAGSAVKKKMRDEACLTAAGKEILERLSISAVLMTRDENGMTLFQRNRVEHLPPQSGAVVDVTGAGDTVTAVFALALSCKQCVDMRSAAELSNLAAGIVVGKMGCATVTPTELREAIETR